MGAGQRLPLSGTVFISVGDDDKAAMLPVARQFASTGFRRLMATRRHLVGSFWKPAASRPNGSTRCPQGGPRGDAIKNRHIQLVINTGSGDEPRRDGYDDPPGGP
jgi:carbamoyl-phosphate synthase large subunit